MTILEYSDKYIEDVKDLLVELEEYIISIDKDNLDDSDVIIFNKDEIDKII